MVCIPGNLQVYLCSSFIVFFSISFVHLTSSTQHSINFFFDPSHEPGFGWKSFCIFHTCLLQLLHSRVELVWNEMVVSLSCRPWNYWSLLLHCYQSHSAIWNEEWDTFSCVKYCEFICLCIYICGYRDTDTRSHIYAHKHTHVCMHARTQTSTHTHVCTHAYKQTHTDTCTHLHTGKPKHQTHKHKHSNTNTQTHSQHNLTRIRSPKS